MDNIIIGSKWKGIRTGQIVVILSKSTDEHEVQRVSARKENNEVITLKSAYLVEFYERMSDKSTQKSEKGTGGQKFDWGGNSFDPEPV